MHIFLNLSVDAVDEGLVPLFGYFFQKIQAPPNMYRNELRFWRPLKKPTELNGKEKLKPKQEKLPNLPKWRVRIFYIKH